MGLIIRSVFACNSASYIDVVQQQEVILIMINMFDNELGFFLFHRKTEMNPLLF